MLYYFYFCFGVLWFCVFYTKPLSSIILYILVFYLLVFSCPRCSSRHILIARPVFHLIFYAFFLHIFLQTSPPLFFLLFLLYCTFLLLFFHCYYLLLSCHLRFLWEQSQPITFLYHISPCIFTCNISPIFICYILIRVLFIFL